MKKTLFALALMAAFGSQVMADEPPTWDFNTTIYGTQWAAGNYKGISFSLTNDSDRYTAEAPPLSGGLRCHARFHPDSGSRQ